MRYHSGNVRFLTLYHDLVKEQFQAGSLTGAVASQSVTEARDGGLRPVGHRLRECKGTSPPDCERDSASREETRP